jgi:hypothetical protein
MSLLEDYRIGIIDARIGDVQQTTGELAECVYTA